MYLGEVVDNSSVPTQPAGLTLDGQSVKLLPLNAEAHAQDLFRANSEDKAGKNWLYLPYGPFITLEEYKSWLSELENKADPVFFTIIRKSDNRPVGIASYLRINPNDYSIEVGHIHFSPLLQRTKEATEAMYLMMKWVYSNGYRRYEWKCNALNIKSRQAAQRLGFSYEGVFRQMSISKGRNRNTAWFASIDKEWPALEQCFERYLSNDNFDEKNTPKIALSTLTKDILYKRDNLEFSE